MYIFRKAVSIAINKGVVSTWYPVCYSRKQGFAFLFFIKFHIYSQDPRFILRIKGFSTL